eukprot:12889605-Prorocentrum_lima.AAC.1
MTWLHSNTPVQVIDRTRPEISPDLASLLQERLAFWDNAQWAMEKSATKDIRRLRKAEKRQKQLDASVFSQPFLIS